MNDEPDKTKSTHLGIDDLLAIASDLARNGDGAQKTQAIRLLLAAKGGAVTLPEPMGEMEEKERLGRIMRSVGKDKTKDAYAWAFRADRRGVIEQVGLGRVTPEMQEQANRITSLPMLNRAFPGMKKHGGTPIGYPIGKGPELKVAWCQRTALQCLLDREELRIQMENDAARKLEKEEAAARKAAKEGTDGEPPAAP